ncbi:MAG: hypothetical protein ACD_67C00109G0004 [uncultured bacterium]|nr:MAG: hypothetical protein ACD_67C00109G0004 [uncultured bacterium]
MRVGRDLFGGEVEEEVEEISGRKVIGTIEKVKLIGKDESDIEVEAKIDTGAGFTSIDTDLARRLGFGNIVDAFEKVDMSFDEIKNLTKEQREELFAKVGILNTALVHSSSGSTYRPVVVLDLVLDEITMSTKVTIIDRSHLQYQMIIGKRNLGKFLIDVNK